LEQLGHVAPSLLGVFIPKPELLDDLVFNVITDGPISHMGESYIALSYRWNSRSLVSCRTHGTAHEFIFPTSPAMYHALLEERRSTHEGLWVDQICINQDDKQEQHVAVGAMDRIFQNARAVVIALDDIQVKETEAMYLHSYICGQKPVADDGTPEKGVYLHISEIVKNILQADWFERAWCEHEMRFAREHIFLVPYKRQSSSRPFGIMRFNGRIFHNLLQHLIFSELSYRQSQVSILSKAIYLSEFFSEHKVPVDFYWSYRHPFKLVELS
jgi:hypothetical protein